MIRILATTLMWALGCWSVIMPFYLLPFLLEHARSDTLYFCVLL